MSKIPFAVKVIFIGVLILAGAVFYILNRDTTPKTPAMPSRTAVLLIDPRKNPTSTPIPSWTPPWKPTSATRTPYMLTPYQHTPQNIYSPTPMTCRIKGNVNSKGEKYYHCPNYPTYSRTKVQTSQGDRWFCTEAEAIAAGFVSGAKGYGCQP